MKGTRGREVGRKKEGEAGVRECLRVQKYNNNKKEERSGADWRGERKEGREKKPHELLEWCASSSPLAYPKIPGAGNVKARRTTDAIPQRGSAGIISEGNGGLKWRTNFSKTSSERNVHALRLFFHPFHLLPLHSPFSLFILPLCRVSATTPLFCQINISQNKSQDNFKLAREEKRDGVRRARGALGFSSSASCEVESASPASPHFEVCGFVFCISAVWWGRHNCSWMPKEGGQGANVHARRTFTYLCHKQKEKRKSSSTW